MHQPVPKTLLALVLFTSGALWGCDSKLTTTDLLLSHGNTFRRDPIVEPMFYSRQFPGVYNPFAAAGVDTRFDAFARRTVRIGDLYRHDLNFLRLACWEDGATGFTPTLIGERTFAVPSDGRYRVDLRQFLTDEGFTSATPDQLRCRWDAGAQLTLGGKAALKTARKLFLGGGEPYPFTTGVQSAFAMAVTTVNGSTVIGQQWFHQDAFGEGAFD